MITRAITAGLTRVGQMLSPRITTNEIAVLKPFENPSEWRTEDLSKEQIDRLSKDTKRTIEHREGIKRTGEDKVDFMTSDEISGLLKPNKVDSFYTILVGHK